MGKKNDAKRAAKKHAKEKKRAKKLAVRDAPAPSALERWKPATHGVEGLARLLRITPREASRRAARVAGTGGTKGADAVWHVDRVTALSTEALVAEVAARGIATDAATFAELAAHHTSAYTLADDLWISRLPPDATPHDRDLLREAAATLWARWCEAPSDEELLERLDHLHDQWYELPSRDLVDALLDLWDRFAPHGGEARIDRVGGTSFAGLLLDALELADEVADEYDGFEIEDDAFDDESPEHHPVDHARADAVVRELLDTHASDVGDDLRRDLLRRRATTLAREEGPGPMLDLLLALPEADRRWALSHALRQYVRLRQVDPAAEARLLARIAELRASGDPGDEVFAHEATELLANLQALAEERAQIERDQAAAKGPADSPDTSAAPSDTELPRG